MKKNKRKRIIPHGWKEIKISDVFETSSGSTPTASKQEYYENGDIPWINSGELTKPYIYRTNNFITKEGYDNSSTKMYPIDTVLVAMYGATAGKASILKMEACTNQAVCAILPNPDYDPLFIKYSIDTLYDYLVGLSTGSARDNLSQAGIKDLKLIVPNSLKEQKQLASVLATLDKKITLNRQINDNLEAMARQLYDYWFVQFDFPDENGRPYKSSGGKMVWNEMLKRDIPEAWETSTIKDIAKTYSGGTPKSTNSEFYENGNIPWINSGELNEPIITSSPNYITQLGLDNSSAKKYPKGTILIALYGATAGKVSYLSFEACSNQAVCGVMTNNKALSDYVRYYLSSLYEHFVTLSTGSARSNISQETVKDTMIILPSNKILAMFNKVSNNIMKVLISNKIQIDSLTKQRDELLPLLMNGQATVNYHLSDD